MNITHRFSWRVRVGIALLATVVLVLVFHARGGGVEAAEPPAGIKVGRANLVVSVGGVGRIVEARTSFLTPSASGSASGGSSATFIANAVYPRTGGRIAKLFVEAGKRVAEGQVVAIIDDGGVSANAIKQAESDLATAELELRQRQTSDPQRGTRATAEELNAARLAVSSASKRLAQLQRPPRPADVSAARLERSRAKAELAAIPPLAAPVPAGRAAALRAAKRSIVLAQERYDRLFVKPNPADVSLVDAEIKKAEADLAALKQILPAPQAEAIAAVEKAISVAQLRLAKLKGTQPDPVDVGIAVADLQRAQADLAALQRSDPPSADTDLIAARAALEAARLKLVRVQRPVDGVDIAAAELDVERARAELAALLRRPQAVMPEAVEAAEQALAAARLKRERLFRKPDKADVTAARLELDRAHAELAALKIVGPSKAARAANEAARAAARQAIEAARTKVRQVLRPALPADITAARLDIQKAEADLAVLKARGGPASEFDIELAGLKVKAAKAKLAAARSSQNLLTVYSPAAGTVTALYTADGSTVDPTTPILAVADLSKLAVSVDLSEFDVAQVSQGLKAIVSVDALGGKAFPGKVLYTAPSGTDNGGIVTFPVRVGLTAVKGLKPGMNVSVRIIVAQKRNVLQVPLEAVTRDDENNAIVNVVNAAGKILEREVTLGLSNNKNVEILEGLRAGERVVVEEPAAPGEEE
jgi:HlyD family secretion protein